MQRLSWYIVSILMVCNLPAPAAQSTDLTFEYFSTTLVKLYFQVIDILEDHLGFIWFATKINLYQLVEQ